MEKEFIPYEQALELKYLGFDLPCLGYYHNTLGSDNASLFIKETTTEIYEMINLPEDIYTLAPLYQQAFRWFREKYDSSYWVQKDWEEGNFLGYEGTIEYIDGFRYCGTFNTYEEAELACLKKLIEVVKNK
jgi:hypothetical protein